MRKYRKIICLPECISALLYLYSKVIKRNHLFISLQFLIFFLILFPFTTLASQEYNVYFYNPETNINNFASLKKEFDTYLSALGNYRFQPFSDRDTFEKFIVGKNDGIFIVSSWHFRILKERIPMEPVLVAVSKNKSTCRRILTAKNSINSMILLKGVSIASASSEDYTKNVLRQMLGKNSQIIVPSMNILTVPKDIDALMSVGFGMAAAALTTENSFTKLEMINRKQYEMMRQLAISEEILLPIIAIPKPLNDDCKKLLTIIKEMGTINEGKGKLTMLGLDGWRDLNESEKRSLEK